jgi:hypothetical protein
MQKYEDCIRNIDLALKIQPAYCDALFLMGMAKLKNNELNESKAFFVKAKS